MLDNVALNKIKHAKTIILYLKRDETRRIGNMSA